MKLLLLAGTGEARALAERLAGDARFDVLASLAGATRTPAAYAVPVRSGGFGGAEMMRKFLQDNAFDAVIDATHPFARVMPGRAQAVCAGLGLPYLRLLRPGWSSGPGDDWTRVATEAAVARVVAPGARVLLATGARSLPRFSTLAEGRTLFARVIDPPGRPFPFAGGAWLVGRPPFTVESELETLRLHRIDVLVAKDAGGPAVAKLAAARALGLPVVLVDRPPAPPGDRVADVDGALAWLERLL